MTPLRDTRVISVIWNSREKEKGRLKEL